MGIAVIIVLVSAIIFFWLIMNNKRVEVEEEGERERRHIARLCYEDVSQAERLVDLEIKKMSEAGN